MAEESATPDPGPAELSKLPPPAAPHSPPPPSANAPTTPGAPSRKRPFGLVLIVFVLLGTLVAGATFMLTREDEDPASTLDEREILLEPAASVGPDPFSGEVFGDAVTDSTVLTSTTSVPATTSSPATTPAAAATTSAAPTSATVVATVSGGTPGLYGGTRDLARCDAPAMLRFLQSHPDKARAWVEAMNSDPTLRWRGGVALRVEHLPTYFADLTPLVLTRDTRVTNHGFHGGHPVPRQAVLQAGTAVLVDRFGVPRARCYCGNPLTPPRPVPTSPEYVGTAWIGFNQQNIVVINDNDTEINIFIVNDLTTGEQFERPPGTKGDGDTLVTTTTTSTTTTTTTTSTTIPLPEGVTLGEGDVQVTLQWAGDADMDLHVVDPTGTEIYYDAKQSPSGGSLDVDQVPLCGSGGAPAVENVFWPTNGAPAGTYSAFVEAFRPCDRAQGYVLIVRVRGEIVHNVQASLSGLHERSEPVTFTL